VKPIYLNGGAALYLDQTHAVVHGPLDHQLCNCLLALLTAGVCPPELVLHEASGTVEDAYLLLNSMGTIGVRAAGRVRGAAALLTFCGAPGRRWADPDAQFELTVDDLGGPSPGRSGVALGDMAAGRAAWARAFALRSLTVYLMRQQGLDAVHAMDLAEQGIVLDAAAAMTAGHVDGLAKVDIVFPSVSRGWSFDLPCARPA